MKKSNLKKLNEQLAEIASLSKSLDLEVNHGQQMTDYQLRDTVDFIFKQSLKAVELAHKCLTA